MPDALRIAREVADALDYAHRQGVVHRDIKPENILIGGGHALVADFGIARQAGGRAGGTEERLTETGLSLGTPHYMSPEQAAADRDLDARSDIYSLGCVVYEMLAGEPPYTGATQQAVLAKRLTEPVPRVSTLRQVVPSIEQAVTRALARAPADRFATAADFAAALADTGTAIVTPTAVTPTAVSPAAARRSRLTVPLAAAALDCSVGEAPVEADPPETTVTSVRTTPEDGQWSSV